MIGVGLSLTGKLRSSVSAPASIFSLDEPGIWLDPSDLTTLFQDTAGTQPVTAAGQSVALALDKSRGLVLGSELVTNGTFDTNLNGWTLGTDPAAVIATWDNGRVSLARGAGSNAGFSQTTSTVVGRSYRVSFTVVSGVVAIGGAFPTIGGLTAGQFSRILVATSGALSFWPNSPSSTAVIDNISVRELPGNHATQSVLASRPIYSVVPATGRRNILTETLFAGAVAGTPGTAPTSWPFNSSGGSITSAANCVIGFSVTGARQIIGQVVTVAANQTQTWSVTVVSNPNGLSFNQLFAVINPTGLTTLSYFANGVTITATTYVPQAGERLSALLINGGTQITPTFRIGVGVSAIATGAASFTSPQAELGSVVTPYQRVVSQYDVTEAGVQSLSYLAFDGVDDFLVTPTITPNINKVQVFAGVRKLSDAAIGMLVEHSADLNVNAGTFWLGAPIVTNAGNYNFLSRGSIVPANGAGAFNATAPSTNVITGLGDISADSMILRNNGVNTGSSVLDQGTGNYLAYPLYIGRRGGTTLPFNGNLFGLIVRFGASLSADKIKSVENWMATRTGVTF